MSAVHDRKDEVPRKERIGSFLEEQRKQLDTPSKGVMLGVKDLQRVELLLIKAVQNQPFPQEIET